MLAVQLTGIEEMALVEMNKPERSRDDEVLVRVKSVGVCGSDIHYYSEGQIGTQVVAYPFVVGHECSGVVESCGPAVKGLVPGDLVVIDPSVHCGECDQCRAGRPHTCRNNRFLGCPGQLEGCLKEYVVMPSFCCYPVTGRVDADEAALVEPLSIGVYAVRQAALGREARCAIFGAGPIGLSVLMKLRADGMEEITVVEPLSYRLEKALEVGAAYGVNPAEEQLIRKVSDRIPGLLDAVFEASGEQQAVTHALELLKPGGKLILIGIPPSARFTFDMDLMRRKEITVINIRRQNHCVEEAIELVASGKIRVKQMVTHYFQLRKTPVAFDMVAGYRDNVIKAMIFL
ncbi:MAG TPA: alcohol dehydrogenase catalytic domain-containing protein [Prolixibacteraceae bacterium]|nr:alcohol dehydrogenase catalytic domain-containing protein [Prolixibacteraceae bacterium]HOY52870.1 alcohol dehydrogenase catalytic domain-containing protein [Prolixibacteraceae bacterium]